MFKNMWSYGPVLLNITNLCVKVVHESFHSYVQLSSELGSNANMLHFKVTNINTNMLYIKISTTCSNTFP